MRHLSVQFDFDFEELGKEEVKEVVFDVGHVLLRVTLFDLLLALCDHPMMRQVVPLKLKTIFELGNSLPVLYCGYVSQKQTLIDFVGLD